MKVGIVLKGTDFVLLVQDAFLQDSSSQSPNTVSSLLHLSSLHFLLSVKRTKSLDLFLSKIWLNLPHLPQNDLQLNLLQQLLFSPNISSIYWRKKEGVEGLGDVYKFMVLYAARLGKDLSIETHFYWRLELHSLRHMPRYPYKYRYLNRLNLITGYHFYHIKEGKMIAGNVHLTKKIQD